MAQETKSKVEQGAKAKAEQEAKVKAEQEAKANVEKQTDNIYTDIHGGNWTFKKNTPDSFRFNGVVKTKEEWLADEDAMEMLVYGKSTYIKQIKN